MVTKTNFRAQFRKAKIVPSNPPKQWFQNRGKLFERILYYMLLANNLQPRLDYKIQGEQIDGSFILAGRVYLLEAKWHQDPIEVASLLTFQGKVEGKLSGTVGVFLSMSGYVGKAADALTKGKPLNVIMFNSEDVDACLDANVGFKRVLESKIRIAAEEGLIYWPYRSSSIAKASVPKSGSSKP